MTSNKAKQDQYEREKELFKMPSAELRTLLDDMKVKGVDVTVESNADKRALVAAVKKGEELLVSKNGVVNPTPRDARSPSEDAAARSAELARSGVMPPNADNGQGKPIGPLSDGSKETGADVANRVAQDEEAEKRLLASVGASDGALGVEQDANAQLNIKANTAEAKQKEELERKEAEDAEKARVQAEQDSGKGNAQPYQKTTPVAAVSPVQKNPKEGNEDRVLSDADLNRVVDAVMVKTADSNRSFLDTVKQAWQNDMGEEGLKGRIEALEKKQQEAQEREDAKTHLHGTVPFGAKIPGFETETPKA